MNLMPDIAGAMTKTADAVTDIGGAMVPDAISGSVYAIGGAMTDIGGAMTDTAANIGGVLLPDKISTALIPKTPDDKSKDPNGVELGNSVFYYPVEGHPQTQTRGHPPVQRQRPNNARNL